MSCTHKAELILLTVFLCDAYLIEINTNQAWTEQGRVVGIVCDVHEMGYGMNQ